MSKYIIAASIALFLVACNTMDETTKMRIKQFSDACAGGNQGACMVLSSYFQSRNAAALAGQQNILNATRNTTDFAIQQQNTGTYSGGGYGGNRSICSVNTITGQETCY